MKCTASTLKTGVRPNNTQKNCVSTSLKIDPANAVNGNSC